MNPDKELAYMGSFSNSRKKNQMKNNLLLNKGAVFLFILVILFSAVSGSVFAEELQAVAEANPTFGDARLDVQFNGSKSTGDIVSYYWEFGDGTNWDGDSVSNGLIRKDYPEGTYVATLTVENETGYTSSDSVIIGVPCVDLDEFDLSGPVSFSVSNDMKLCPKTYNLNATSSVNALVFTKDDITLDCNDAIIHGNGEGIGIYAENRNNIEIKNCNVENYYEGIYLLSSTNSVLSDIVVSNNEWVGISLNNSNSSLIKNINASNNGLAGIVLFSSSLNNITNVFASGNSYCGVALASSSKNNRITNTISLNNEKSGLYFYDDSSNNHVQSNILNSNNESGIYLLTSNNNTIINNELNSNEEHGIHVQGASTNNTITYNSIQLSTSGIYFNSINLGDNIVLRNQIYNNTYGISVENSNKNFFRRNTVSNNTQVGISINGTSEGNQIYNNYFANNAINAHAPSETLPNYWYIDKIDSTNIIGGPYIAGNYWDDYTGNDTSSPPDGIGNEEIPYTSNGNIKRGGDFAPLVSMPTSEIIEISPSPAYFEEETTFTGSGKPSISADIDKYEWKSSLHTTVLSNASSFSTSELSLGNHTISLRVLDSEDKWSYPAIRSLDVLPTGDLNFTKWVVDFGPLASGQNKTVDIEIKNIGIQSFTNLTAESPKDYLAYDFFHTSLLPNTSTILSLTITAPNKTSNETDFQFKFNVTGITSDKEETYSLTIKYQLPLPELTVTPSPIKFGSVEPGSTNEKTVVLSNEGPIIVKDIDLTLNSTNISFTQPSVILEPEENTSFRVTLSVPEQLDEGDYSELLEISWNNQSLEVPITYKITTVILPEPKVSPSSWSAGTLAPEQTKTKTFTISLETGSFEDLTAQPVPSDSQILIVDKEELILEEEKSFTATLITPTTPASYSESIEIKFFLDDEQIDSIGISITFKIEENVASLISSARTKANAIENRLNNVEGQTTQGTRLYKEIQDNVSQIKARIADAKAKLDEAELADVEEANSLITQANSDLSSAESLIESLESYLNKPKEEFLGTFKYIFILIGVGVAAAVFLFGLREGWIDLGGIEENLPLPFKPKKRSSMGLSDMEEPEKRPKRPTPKRPTPTSPQQRPSQAPETMKKPSSSAQAKQKAEQERKEKWRKYYQAHPEEAKKWRRYYQAHPELKKKEEGQTYRSYKNRRFE